MVAPQAREWVIGAKWCMGIGVAGLLMAGTFNGDAGAWLFLLMLATDWASDASPCGDAGPFEKLA
jgi:hypothetical protein